jgi:hypothetical protein
MTNAIWQACLDLRRAPPAGVCSFLLIIHVIQSAIDLTQFEEINDARATKEFE